MITTYSKLAAIVPPVIFELLGPAAEVGFAGAFDVLAGGDATARNAEGT